MKRMDSASPRPPHRALYIPSREVDGEVNANLRRLSSSTVVRLRDCDSFGHLHNSRYIDYFLEAREDQMLDAYALNLSRYANVYGIGWFITENRIRYLSPVSWGQTIEVLTRLLVYDEQRMRIEFLMLETQSGRPAALYWTDMKCIDTRLHASRRHDRHLMKLFEAIVSTTPAITFEERVIEVRDSAQ